MNSIQREIQVKIGEKAFSAKFPNVGQMIDMESLKQALTSNRYGVMSASGVKSMFIALDLVDAIAFFQVCVPQIAKHYDIKNYAGMQLDDIRDITEAYLQQVKPWYDKLLKQLYTATDGGNETTTEGEDIDGESK